MRKGLRTRGGFLRHAGWLFVLSAGFLLFLPSEMESGSGVVLLPQLHPGQTLEYKSVARVTRHAKTQSHVSMLPHAEPGPVQLSINVMLTIREIRTEVGRPVVTAHAELETFPATADGAANSSPAEKAKLDFTIAANGNVSHIGGLDALSPEQGIAWQFWMSQFAYGWTLPLKGVSPGEKWKTEEAENAPTPIAGLSWERETTYVQNDKCPVMPTETCAVLLTRANLKQKSSEEDATPEEYRLHHLKTSGKASGTNETIAYISLKTHLLLRAKEDVQQALDTIVSTEDDSNQVHYLIEVNSQFETVLTPSAPAKP
jgi:hypothetical protein